MKKIIDISEWQGKIDWEKVKGSVDGVIVRAGYGQGNIDQWFEINAKECNRLGIPLGAYWFSYALSAEMARKEAQYFLSAISKFRIELPVAYDWEYDSRNYALKRGVTLTKETVSAMTREFLNACESAGYWSMVYTNPDMAGKYFETSIFGRYDLWLAEWPSKWTEYSKPSRSCGLWQYGGSTVPGIVGNVDSNIAYKDYYTMLRKKTVEIVSDEETVIVSADPIVVEEPDEETNPLAWAKKRGYVDGDSELETVIAKALYHYYMDFQAEDEKTLSGLLTED